MEVWIGRDGERHGPYKEEDIRQWLRSGQVSPSDLAWYEGLADWQPLSVLFPDAVSAVPPASAGPAMASAAALPATNIAALEDYAGFWKRVAAYILDAIILYIPSLFISRLLGSAAAEAAMRQAQLSAPTDPQVMMDSLMQYYATMAPAMLLNFVLAWMYYAFCESSAWQATVGKLALGIRVTDMAGKRLTLGRSLARYPGMILSSMILCIGFLMVAWTRRKQGLHDMLAGTLVLNGRASEFKPTSTARSSDTFSA